MEMAKPGSFVHFLLRSATGQPSRLTGRVVEEGEGEIVVAVLSSKAPQKVVNTVAAPGSSDQPGLTFFRLALSSVSSVLPVGWCKETALPKLSICTAAWSSVGKKVDSSDAEKPAEKKEKVVSGMLSHKSLEQVAQGSSSYEVRGVADRENVLGKLSGSKDSSSRTPPRAKASEHLERQGQTDFVESQSVADSSSSEGSPPQRQHEGGPEIRKATRESQVV